MPGWFSDMVGVFLGAALGALFGYAANAYYDRQEARARRAVMVRVLQNQLSRWEAQPGRFVRGIQSQLRPIEVTVIGALLDGTVLDARKDGQLIEKFLDIQSTIRYFNELIRVYNQTFVLAELNVQNRELTDQRARWYGEGAELYTRFIQLRDEVLSLLAPQLGEPRPSVPDGPV